MIEQGDCGACLINRADIGQRRPPDETDLDAKTARRRQLATGRRTAAVFGNNQIYVVPAQQRHLVIDVEGAAGKQIAGMGQRRRRSDRLDTANDVMVERRHGQRRQLLAAKGCKNIPRLLAGKGQGAGDIIDLPPQVTTDLLPGRAADGEMCNARLARRLGRVARDNGSEGMGRINQHIRSAVAQIVRQSVHPAKAADPHRHCLRNGSACPSGQ